VALKALAPAVAALALASPAQLSTPASPLLRLVPRPAASQPPLPSASKFLQAHRQADGSFKEAEGVASPALAAWAALGLVAAGQAPAGTLDYLRVHEGDALAPATRALVALAAGALGDPQLAGRLSTTAGQTNAIVWTILARRQAGLGAPKSLVSALLARQAKSGGWGWAKGVAPDSNDTAAAVQALRAAGVTGAPIRRALNYLRKTRNEDGGFAIVSSRESDAQSTAWAIQAFVAAGAPVPKGVFTYLRSLRREDGSYRYSRSYVATPVWVTAQVLPAVLKKPFPLR
jgi:Prenyltransferase and squalene oxidase repeat